MKVDPDASAEDVISKLKANEESSSAGLGTVVCYCSIGWRSSKMVERLVAGGVSDVHNLEGSIFKWANERRDLRDGKKNETHLVHPFNSVFGQMLDAEHRYQIEDAWCEII